MDQVFYRRQSIDLTSQLTNSSPSPNDRPKPITYNQIQSTDTNRLPQGDPYAAPSRLRVSVPAAAAAFPRDLYSSPVRRVALRDWLARRFGAVANTATAQNKAGWHGAKGGDVSVDAPGARLWLVFAVDKLGGAAGRFLSWVINRSPPLLCSTAPPTSSPSHYLTSCPPGQHVLERSAVIISDDGAVEARFTVGLPAQGRSIMGQWAAQILADNMPG